MEAARTAAGRKLLATIEGSQQASIAAALADVAPDLAQLAIGFVYGEIYGRPGLDLPQRQLVTVLVDRVFDGSAAKLVLQALATTKASPEELDEIRKLLAIKTGGSR